MLQMPMSFKDKKDKNGNVEKALVGYLLGFIPITIRLPNEREKGFFKTADRMMVIEDVNLKKLIEYYTGQKTPPSGGQQNTGNQGW